MLRETAGARRYNEPITLTKANVTVDDYGHASPGAAVKVLDVFAYVRRMSATKTMLTFQQADIIGLEIEFRAVGCDFNGIIYRGHAVTFSAPEEVDGRGRILKITGYYQQDNPL